MWDTSTGTFIITLFGGNLRWWLLSANISCVCRPVVIVLIVLSVFSVPSAGPGNTKLQSAGSLHDRQFPQHGVQREQLQQGWCVLQPPGVPGSGRLSHRYLRIRLRRLLHVLW